MRTAAIWMAGAAFLVSGCVLPPYEEYRERRIGVQRPVAVVPQDGTTPEVIYVPQGPTNFYVDYYTPAPYYYDAYGYPPGYGTYYAPQPGWYPSYGTAPGYGGYGGYIPRSNEKGVVGVPPGAVYYGGGYYGGGYYGGGVAPAGANTTGGSKYYPGSGASTQPGQSRESYGIYGSGNSR
jgi:hypothetical protein